MKQFTKNDQSFICSNCGKLVNPLKYSSRDHCNGCLYSIHIDIMPGDRKNNCLGKLIPIAIEQSGKKGYVIKYKCEKCGEIVRNKSAEDDNFNTMIEIINKSIY